MPRGIYKRTKYHKKVSRKNGFQKGNIPWNKGKKGLQKHSQKIRNKISKTMKERFKKQGYLNSPEKRKKISKSLKGKPQPWNRGKNHPNWKEGRIKTTDGYIMITKPQHPFCDNKSYVREHRLVIEKYLNRYLKPEEVIHHIDENPSNNRIQNLIVFKNCGYHSAFHRWGYYNPKYIIFDGRKM